MKSVIMAGGSGTRLWPLSRTHYPKQFLKLKGMSKSIFQLTVERSLRLCAPDDLYFVIHKDYLHLVAGQLEEMGMSVPRSNILLEPVARNTLPAILYAVKTIREAKGDDDIVVFPSDHLIGDTELLADVIFKALSFTTDYLITFGITAIRPETGYGYIKPGKSMGCCAEVAEFKEKPNLDTAMDYMAQGYLWNSGMFLLNSKLFIEETQQHSPEVYEAFQLDSIQDCYQASPSVSIDYGLMEKTTKAAVMPFDGGWNDLGNFSSFYTEYNQRRDENGNVFFNDELLLNSSNNMVYYDGDKTVAMIGVSELVVVDQKDALLICHKDDTQRVGEVVNILKKRGDRHVDYHMTEYRPWGSFTVLEENLFYKVKRLSVLPGKRLSYQMHYHRSEHWVAVNGTALIILNGEERLLFSGESIYIAAGCRHRLHNVGKLPLEIIEVQSGQYLGEDDIVRFADDFER